MPQVLKNEIRHRILDNAMNSFIEKGFRATSMKAIAQKSGIAVGNIYNYFKDKKTLYDTITQPVLDEINNLFTAPPQIPIVLHADMKIHKFIDIYKKNTKVFVMALENDVEAGFDAVKDIVINNFSEAITKAKSQITQKASQDKDKVFIKAFTGAYINGIISIMNQEIDESIKLEILQEFLTMMKTALIAKFGFPGKD